IIDEQTEPLKRALPQGARYWGRARKCLNIFLREASYNYLLRDTFRLGELDQLLETPLDSRVAKGLRDDAGAHRLPRWASIIALNPDDSAKYQAVAAQIAQTRYMTVRANLDLWYWRPLHDVGQSGDAGAS